MKSHTTKIAGIIAIAIGLFIGVQSIRLLYHTYKEPLKIGDMLISNSSRHAPQYDFRNPFTKDPVIGTDSYKILDVKNGYCLYEHKNANCVVRREPLLNDQGDTVDFFRDRKDSVLIDTNSAECRPLYSQNTVLPKQYNIKLISTDAMLFIDCIDGDSDDSYKKLISAMNRTKSKMESKK